MRLKRLIMVGFKSFADKTVFDFHDGITCIVGPNGCGKSNVVDGIKWVLGEQSAKSLRGSEMQDVIFSGSSVRKSSGIAEVELVFDNSDGLVTPPSAGHGAEGEISIARRLYRSGQSEYLINQAPARLRDIKELFMDTGIGTDGYGVIEQGRVEMFLNASTEDRRQIFDEAAGISKYKARKKEAMRKLERVDQNILRINDSLADVERRLRSVKLQAGKARNFTAYTEQLNELKSLFYLSQYHWFGSQRSDMERRAGLGGDQLKLKHAEMHRLEQTRDGAEVESAALNRQGRQLQEEHNAVIGKVNTGKHRVELLARRVEELSEYLLNATHRCEELETKLDSVAEQLAQSLAELQQLEVRQGELTESHASAQTETQAGQQRIVESQLALEQAKDNAVDLMRQIGQCQSQLHAGQVKRDNLSAQHERLAARAQTIEQSLAGFSGDRETGQTELDELTARITDNRAQLEQRRSEAVVAADNHHQLQEQLNALREERSGVVSRTDMLRDMLDHLEGVGTGTREALEAARDGQLDGILGMLGDQIRTDVEHAPLVEAALSGADQYLLAESWSTVDAERLNELLGDNGAAEVLTLDQAGAFCSDFTLADCPQARGRVIDYVRFAEWLSPVMWRLLGRTLVVDSLADAAAAAAVAPRGFRFVTLAGEVWEADGRIRLGSGHQASGVITRHSEMEQLQRRLGELDIAIEQVAAQFNDAGTRRQDLETAISELRSVLETAGTGRVEVEGRLRRLDEQISQLHAEQPVVASEVAGVAEELTRLASSLSETEEQLKSFEADNARHAGEIEAMAGTLETDQASQDELNRRLTELKVTLGQVVEKQTSLSRAKESLVAQREHMQRDLDAQREEINVSRERRTQADADIQSTREELEALETRQGQLGQDVADHESSRRSLSERMSEIRKQGETYRKEEESIKDQINGIRQEQGQLAVRIEGLVEKASEELHMNLVEHFGEYQHDDERDWSAVEAEIHDLKGRIERLGNVNLDAITEQEELEAAHDDRAGQLADVIESQKKLSELIDRLNVESHRRFVETFETVRINFHELFRKLFGGGKADLILLDEENPLESGIDIIARPPGKELSRLSLLSGGEKAKTALALIFSFFRSRPSPFCLLDEVDAPLDEANTDQFARMLREFTDQTQFIVISHAKRTMSQVDVLYGVTMQEPGISTRIAVKFEDVHEIEDKLEPVTTS
jgi:chromosome segregation protein